MVTEPKTEAELDDFLNLPKVSARIKHIVDEQLGDGITDGITEAMKTVLGKDGIIKRVPMTDGPETELPVAPLDLDDIPTDHDPFRRLGMISHGSARRNLKRYAKRTAAAKAYAGGGFETPGAFLTACVAVVRGHMPDTLGLKALGEVGGTEGSFLVPEGFSAELLMLAIEESIVRSRARIFPMTRESQTFPTIDETSRATNLWGGVQAFWNAEGADIQADASQPAFRQTRYTANKLTGYTIASKELLDDSAIALEQVILSMFGPALGYFEDIAFIEGTGVGQPIGIKNAAALITVSKETGQAASTLVTENFDQMYMRMLPESRGRAVWVMHFDTIPQLLALSRTVGTGGAPVMMMNIANAPVFVIYGRPVLFTEKCQTLGTLGDVYFADFSYYTIGDRQALEMATSPHVKFITDEIVWKFIQRVDGRSWINSPLTPRNGTTTISPFVTLAARS